ncbi:MAG: DUF3301 domain-containing protein [Burkholderiales bacterium]
MLELSALAVVAGATWFWVDSLRARERAVAAGRAACGRYGLQFLDETVAFVKLRPVRDDEGRLRLRRTYAFEFSDTGDNRRQGVIVTLGGELADVQLEPYRIQ